MRSARRRARALVALVVAATVAACGNPITRPTQPTGGVGTFRRVAFVPILHDDVRVEAIGTTRDGDVQPAGWDTPGLAAKMLSEILAPAGTEMRLVQAPALDAQALEARDWAQQVWRPLHDSSAIGDAEAVVIFRQNAISRMGTQYSPLRGFLGTGLVGLAMEAARERTYYRPVFEVVQNTGLDEAIEGRKPACMIGLDARVVDAATGAVRGAADDVLGRAPLPTPHADPMTLTAGERETARVFCTVALRHAVEQAVRGLGLLRR